MKELEKRRVSFSVIAHDIDMWLLLLAFRGDHDAFGDQAESGRVPLGAGKVLADHAGGSQEPRHGQGD